MKRIEFQTKNSRTIEILFNDTQELLSSCHYFFFRRLQHGRYTHSKAWHSENDLGIHTVSVRSIVSLSTKLL
jgi:hypothetical protein